jgi:hypothetical protein
MPHLTDQHKVLFFKFLNRNIPIQEFEHTLYESKKLEAELEPRLYLQLISFNFHDKSVLNELEKFILENLVEEGEYETWKLKTLLNHFITDYTLLDRQLDTFYHLYCGAYQEDGSRKWQYLFLQNLGLNYFHWLEEDYLKSPYGANWRQKYNEAVQDFEFYHRQLKPIAAEILAALNSGAILILNNGSYTITDELKEKLENGLIFSIQHPL